MTELTGTDKLRMKMIYWANEKMGVSLSPAMARHVKRVDYIADHIKDFALEDELGKLPQYIQKQVQNYPLT